MILIIAHVKKKRVALFVFTENCLNLLRSLIKQVHLPPEDPSPRENKTALYFFNPVCRRSLAVLQRKLLLAGLKI
jgi:hypothetical protein